MGEHQEFIDRFYWSHGPCCSGCDWWRSGNTQVGECLQSQIVPGADRAAALGIRGVSTQLASGHALTQRDYACGKFEDSFDWSTLPLEYLKNVGAPLRKEPKP